jgi:hypothetical protein
MAIEGEFDVTVAPLEASEFISVRRSVTVPRGKGVD